MEVETTIQTLTKELLQTIIQTKQFVVEEAPLYIKEMLSYELMTNYVGIGIIVMVILACSIGAYLCYRVGLQDEKYMIPGGLFCSFVIVAAFSIFPCIANIYKIKYAPRVFIVDYLTNRITPDRR